MKNVKKIIEKDPIKLREELEKHKKELYRERVNRRIGAAGKKNVHKRKDLRKHIARLYTALHKTHKI